MFKEALLGIFCLFLFYLLCKWLWKRSRKALAAITVSILGISCLANIIYNAKVMYPDFYMDTVTGPYRYGTFSENLFSYSDEFMFQDNILFPILKNRQVALDASAGFYEKFISLYAKDYHKIKITDEQRKELIAQRDDFDFSHEFTCIGIMDYVTDEIPTELTASFDEELYPTVYINTASLEGQPSLVILMDTDYTLYVMGEAYYQSIIGGGNNA